jgi:hypothetical protein
MAYGDVWQTDAGGSCAESSETQATGSTLLSVEVVGRAFMDRRRAGPGGNRTAVIADATDDPLGDVQAEVGVERGETALRWNGARSG